MRIFITDSKDPIQGLPDDVVQVTKGQHEWFFYIWSGEDVSIKALGHLNDLALDLSTITHKIKKGIRDHGKIYEESNS